MKNAMRVWVVALWSVLLVGCSSPSLNDVIIEYEGDYPTVVAACANVASRERLRTELGPISPIVIDDVIATKALETKESIEARTYYYAVSGNTKATSSRGTGVYHWDCDVEVSETDRSLVARIVTFEKIRRAGE